MGCSGSKDANKNPNGAAPVRQGAYDPERDRREQDEVQRVQAMLAHQQQQELDTRARQQGGGYAPTGQPSYHQHQHQQLQQQSQQPGYGSPAPAPYTSPPPAQPYQTTQPHYHQSPYQAPPPPPPQQQPAAHNQWDSRPPARAPAPPAGYPPPPRDDASEDSLITPREQPEKVSEILTLQQFASVDQLHEVYPHLDRVVIQEIVESCGGSQEACHNALQELSKAIPATGTAAPVPSSSLQPAAAAPYQHQTSPYNSVSSRGISPPASVIRPDHPAQTGPGHGTQWQVGDPVQAYFQGEWFDAVITARDGADYTVTWVQDQSSSMVPEHELRPRQ